MRFITNKFGLLSLFWIASGVALIVKVLGYSWMDHIAMPFLTLSLITTYYLDKGKNNAFYFSFAFCLLGDLMVLSPDMNYFFSGLMSYWGACLLFFLVVAKEISLSPKTFLQKPTLLIPYAIYGIYFIAILFFLYPHLKELFIPILIYALTLSYVCAHSVTAYLIHRNKATRYLCTGFVLLSISASFIGINKFYSPYSFLRAFETLFFAPTLYFIFLYFQHKNLYEK